MPYRYPQRPQYQQPDPWEQLGNSLLKQIVKQGIKQGASYLNNQYDLTGMIGDLLGFSASPVAGTIGGVVPELAGPMGADLGIGLGAGAGGGASGAGGAWGGIASGLSAGGGIPIAVGAAILTNILMDELNDPGGKVSAAQDYKYLTGKGVPQYMAALQQGSLMAPLLKPTITDPDLIKAFQASRGALKASTLMADPIANSNRKEAGVRLSDYRSLTPAVQQMTPLAWLNTIRAQDLLSKRNPETQKKAFEVPSGPGSLYGRPDEQQLMQMTEEQRLFEKGSGLDRGREGGTLRLNPAQALGMIGNAGGFVEQPLDIASYGILNGNPYGVHYDPSAPGGIGFRVAPPNLDLAKGYLFGPATMHTLEQIDPNNMEQGLMAFLQSQPGYSGSAVAGLY